MGRCIDKSYVCDGDNDCLNNYDEENCPELTCPTGQFKCTLDNICINATKVCDGVYDCPSFTDESTCRITPVRRNCRENEFQCTSDTPLRRNQPVTCIQSRWVCDGHKDCSNGSDEPETCAPKECRTDQFKCSNNLCIPAIWRCGK